MPDDNSFTQPVREITGPLRTHPWQDGPAELIAHGLQHMLQNREDFDRRMAFLLFDLGVETLLKTFLLLDTNASGAAGSHTARSNAATSEKFHEIVEGTRIASQGRLSDADAQHILHYHDIRNRIYHRGNGITVPEHHVREYGTLAVHLLHALLNIDLARMMEEPEELEKPKESDEAKHKREAITEKKQRLQVKVDEIEELAKDIVAHIAPRLLNKRTWRQFEEIFRGQIYRPLGETVVTEEKVRGRSYQVLEFVTIPASPGELMSTTDFFFDTYIADAEVRSFFLNLAEDERKSVISDVIQAQSRDPFSECSPFALSLELLGHWPDFPYDYSDLTIAFARSYPESPELQHEIWDDQDRVIGFYEPSLEEYLTYADQLMRYLDQTVEHLANWLEDSTPGNWGKADR